MTGPTDRTPQRAGPHRRLARGPDHRSARGHQL